MRTLFILLFITILTYPAKAAKVDTVSVYSPSMKKYIKNVVILPEKQKKDMPVVFMLHGAGGSYKTWTAGPSRIKDFVDQYGLVVICPDGAVTSWYFDSPLDSTMRYETYVTKELTQWANENLPISKDRKKRAITGLSMGGHGAFYLAINHPEQWGNIGSTSGGIDFRNFPDSWNIKLRIGEKDKYPENWENYTVFNHIDKIKKGNFNIYVDCGTEDFFYPMNKAFHERLLYEKIPHEYTDRPGAHNWDYWKNSICYQLMFFGDKMSQE